MSSSGTSPSSSIPFKSKKTLHSNSKSLLSDEKSLISKTPEKSAQISSRTRNRKVALSIKDVRKAAESVRRSNDRTDQSKSVEKPIYSQQSGSSSCRSKAAVDKPKKVPEKFEILSKFFDSLDCAIRLLRLKGSASNFSNICPKIECLTDRRFSYGHLAQLKFILPEAIEIKKVLIFDERTSCMKPELHISLNLGVLDNQENVEAGSRCVNLRKLFYTRLSEYVSSHPEINEVPKELLPEPFNLSCEDLLTKTTPLSPVKASIQHLASKQSVISSTNIIEGSHNLQENAASALTIVTSPRKQEKLAGASHLSQSFNRRFSHKVICREAEKIDQASKSKSQIPSHLDDEASIQSVYSKAESCSMAFSPVKLPPHPSYSSNCSGNHASPIRLSALPLPTTPSNKAGTGVITSEDDLCTKTDAADSTPAKLVSTPSRLMVSTPALPPLKKSYMSPEDDSTCSTSKLIRRPPRSRSLIFDTPTKKGVNDDGIDGANSALLDDIFDVLPQSLLDSIREKERKAKEERMPAISQAKRRRQMIAALPKLFNAIFFLFHKRTVITKEELIHKVIAGNSEIVDRREIEEQLNLLIELVPEWISEKTVSSGDLLMCINKLSSAEMVRSRSRLEEAK